MARRTRGAAERRLARMVQQQRAIRWRRMRFETVAEVRLWRATKGLRLGLDLSGWTIDGVDDDGER